MFYGNQRVHRAGPSPKIFGRKIFAADFFYIIIHHPAFYCVAFSFFIIKLKQFLTWNIAAIFNGFCQFPVFQIDIMINSFFTFKAESYFLAFNFNMLIL